jgi:hypothetical protein
MILGLIGGATTLGAGLLTLLFSYFPRKAQSLIGGDALEKVGYPIGPNLRARIRYLLR